MTQPFDVCWDRIRRADTHRNAVAGVWNTFIEKESYTARVNVNNDGTGSIRIRQIEPIPSGVALEIGEFLYQLRAALDACIYETACVNEDARPPADEDKLGFPICLGPHQFKNISWKVKPLTDEQRRLVEAIQPYTMPSGLKPAELPYSFNRAVGILDDWARKDRHRKLHIVATQATRVRPMLRLPIGASVNHIRVVRDVFILEDECEVATFQIAGYRHGMDIQANPNLMLDIGIDEIPPPCHHTDTLGFRMEVMEMGVGAIVGAIMKTLRIDPPKDFIVGNRRMAF